jgi:hypothetical protein
LGKIQKSYVGVRVPGVGGPNFGQVGFTCQGFGQVGSTRGRTPRGISTCTAFALGHFYPVYIASGRSALGKSSMSRIGTLGPYGLLSDRNGWAESERFGSAPERSQLRSIASPMGSAPVLVTGLRRYPTLCKARTGRTGPELTGLYETGRTG